MQFLERELRGHAKHAADGWVGGAAEGDLEEEVEVGGHGQGLEGNGRYGLVEWCLWSDGGCWLVGGEDGWEDCVCVVLKR